MSSVDALVEQLIQKSNGSKDVDGDAAAAGQSTPIQSQEKPDITNIDFERMLFLSYYRIIVLIYFFSIIILSASIMILYQSIL